MDIRSFSFQSMASIACFSMNCSRAFTSNRNARPTLTQGTSRNLAFLETGSTSSPRYWAASLTFRSRLPMAVFNTSPIGSLRRIFLFVLTIDHPPELADGLNWPALHTSFQELLNL